MDSIEIQGKNYISSKRAAKATGYAQDYIGQLARGDKVPATRIGRSWYVSEIDILKHSGKFVVEKEDTAQIDVEVSQNTSNLKSLASLKAGNGKSDYFKTWNSVQYIFDDSDLLPGVSIKEGSHNVDEQNTNKNIVIPVRRIKQNESKHYKADSAVDGLKKIRTNEKHIKIDVEAQVPKKHSYAFAGSLVAVHLLIAVLPVVGGVVLSGVSVSSEWIVSNSQLSTAYGADFSLILGYFDSVTSDWIHLVLSSFDLFLSSFGDFFNTGLNFIKELLNIG